MIDGNMYVKLYIFPFFAFLACKEKDKKLLTVCLKLYLKPMAQDTEVI